MKDISIKDLWEMDLDDEDCPKITEDDEKFALEMKDLIQGLINNEQTVNEEFISKSALVKHFNTHCIGNHTDRKSKKSGVFYDFTNIDKYRNYENMISDGVRTTKMSIYTLYQTDEIMKFFRRFFEGNKYMRFDPPCGFRNDSGPVIVGLHSYSSNVTTNYRGGNTVDVCILSTNGKTITLYPLDAHYLEAKFNNLVSNHSEYDGDFAINND